MCASYGLQRPVRDVVDEYTLDEKAIDYRGLARWMDEWAGERNISTTRKGGANLSPIVRQTPRGRSLELSWWWLWIGGKPAKATAFNARADRLLASTLWSPSFRSRRALVPATRYFERKWRFDRDGELFSMAAIYTVTKNEEGWLVSYAIVTHDPVPRFAQVHDRQPLLVPRGFYDDWLDPDREGDPALIEEAIGESVRYSEDFSMTAPEA